jgi:tRNA(Ile)-lysidine synthase TilS/MesJ
MRKRHTAGWKLKPRWIGRFAREHGIDVLLSGKSAGDQAATQLSDGI